MAHYMDFLASFLQHFWWVIPLAIIVGIIKSPRGKGIVGEMLVKIIAKIRLDKDIYHRVHNITLPTPDGTTQIDHVFVSKYGIFVLETKNLQGWIFGGEKQAQWTQKIYKNSFKFQNPLRQNFKHLKALENALQVPATSIHSVVVFIGDSTFKTEMPPNVTKDTGFVSYIKSFRESVLSEAEVTDVLQRIESGRLALTSNTAREHVRTLKARKNPVAERLCPKCGSKLVVRTTKSGARAGQKFWGCSAFPKCRIVQEYQ